MQKIANPPLTTTAQFAEFREWAKIIGQWSDDVIAGWSDAECNTLYCYLGQEGIA